MKLTGIIAALLATSCVAVASHDGSDDSRSSEEYDDQIRSLLTQQPLTGDSDKSDQQLERSLAVVGAIVGAGATAAGIYLSAKFPEHCSTWWKSPTVHLFAGLGATIEVIDEIKNYEVSTSSPLIIGSKMVIGGIKGTIFGVLTNLAGKQISQSRSAKRSWLKNPKSLLAVGLTTALGASVGNDLAGSWLK